MDVMDRLISYYKKSIFFIYYMDQTLSGFGNYQPQQQYQTMDFDFDYEEDLGVAANRAVMQDTVHTALDEALDQVYLRLNDFRSDFNSHQT